MAISIKHTFQSAKSDGPDDTIVQPSDWNDEHVLTLAAGNVLGRASGAGNGAVQELPFAIATDGTTVISANSSTTALRITQTGAGDALVVEDSANPDATPVVIDNNGRLVVGNTAPVSTLDGTNSLLTPGFQLSSGGAAGATQSIQYYASTASGASTLSFDKSRGSLGTQTAVNSGDTLGSIVWNASDGTSFVQAARIQASVDGTPGLNDMPGRLVFSTTADGASSPTERMRIDSEGRIGIATSAVTGNRINIGGNTAPNNSGSVTGLNNVPTIQSDITGTYTAFRSSYGTQAASFTVSSVYHFRALQGTLGATSAVTSQYGFEAANSLTGATNNYGFYGNIADGTGRWNFYANGTAPNYFAGHVRLNNATSMPIGLAYNFQNVGKSSNEGVALGMFTNDTASMQIRFGKSRSADPATRTIVQSGDELGLIGFYGDDGVDMVNRAAAIAAYVDGAPGSNDMPGRLVFFTTPDGSSSIQERMRITSAGVVNIPSSGKYQKNNTDIIPWINVETDYGAVGDGSTDDTTAINNAIAAANSATYGATIYFPPGNYKVTAALTPITKSGVKLVGAGIGQTKISRYYVSAAYNLITFAGNSVTIGAATIAATGEITGCGVEGIFFDDANYHGSVTSTSTTTTSYQIVVLNTRETTIRDITSRDAEQGIYIRRANTTVLNNVVIDNLRGYHGIFCEHKNGDAASDIFIYDNVTVAGFGTSGVGDVLWRLKGAVHSHYIKKFQLLRGRQGILSETNGSGTTIAFKPAFIQGTMLDVEYQSFQGADFKALHRMDLSNFYGVQNNTGSATGINFQTDCEGIVIHSGYFAGATTYGLAFDGVNDVLISNINSTGNNGTGINIASCTRAVVSNCIVNANTNIGVNFSTGGTATVDGVITGCIVKGNTVSQIAGSPTSTGNVTT